MNGKHISEFLDKYEDMQVLSDAEINLLKDGIEFLYQFHHAQNQNSMAVYYGCKLETIESVIRNRTK